MTKVVIIGAGPAGLTAAYQLHKRGADAVVLERDKLVGGISKTVNYRNYLFDLGGHRFFTKIREAEDIWKEVLSQDLLRRSRLSRIYYNKKYFYYPLRPVNALLGLGLWNSALIFFSYFHAHLFPCLPEENLEKWVTNRFGKRLYNTFFKTYTEKVWGIPCSEIRAEWAAQRIQGLSLKTALRNALLKQRNGGYVIKTLIDSFEYPKFGPGMMWQRVADIVSSNGIGVCLGTSIEKVIWDRETGRVNAVEVNEDGSRRVICGTDFISSMPVQELISKMSPAPSDDVIEAANKLRYRDFLTVALIVNQGDLFPDNWIYVHDPDVKVGRVQNFKNWSPFMVPDPAKTALGLEYFCFEGDELWNKPDAELVELGTQEMAKLGLLNASDVEDGTVVRVLKAYPAYDSNYPGALNVVRQFLGGISNLQLIGRNGMHRYNNQDHSMRTAMLAVENIYGARHDLWKVNVEREYHEEKREEISEVTEAALPEEAVVRAFARLDKLGIATAIGTVAGLALFLATLWLVARGDVVARTSMALLSEYFYGYRVTVEGAFVGFGFAFFSGFLFGWLFAYLRNASLAFYVYVVKRKTEWMSFRDFLDQY
jgi:protoporphyrinogen oxidase